MESDFLVLQSSLKSLESSIDGVISTLGDILSRENKTFTVKYKGQLYDFHPSVTLEEVTHMNNMRVKFIKRVVAGVVSRNILKKSTDWNDILSFAMGPDPKHFQFYKIKLDEVFAVADEEGDKVTSLPLNQKSIYVKMQDARNDNQIVELAQE